MFTCVQVCVRIHVHENMLMSDWATSIPKEHGNDVIVAVLGAKQRLSTHHFKAHHPKRPHVC